MCCSMYIKGRQEWLKVAVMLLILLSFLYMVTKYRSNTSVFSLAQDNQPKSDKIEFHHAELNISQEEFQQVLTRYADDSHIIAISLVDSGYLDLAVNLYLSSYKVLNITNYLFISADSQACLSFMQIVPDIHCFHYVNDADADKPYSFGSPQFIRKTLLKTLIVRNVLKLGFTVLLVDLDIVMLKDPFPYLLKCDDCDFQVQHDHEMPVNSGFYFVKPTKLALKMFDMAWNTTLKNADKNSHGDQVVILQVLQAFEKNEKTFKFITLPENIFCNGYYYFQVNKFMFAYDGKIPPETIIVHGNFIASEAAKIYRLKEQLMWFYDKNGYYSDENAKYILYHNPINDTFIKDIVNIELDALISAFIIGSVLNRIVILPSFSCSGCNIGACQNVNKRCSLNTHFKIKVVDEYLGGCYREHVFLRHPLVPKDVLKSRSEVIMIETLFTKTNAKFYTSFMQKPVVHYTPKDTSHGANEQEIREWFSKYNDVSILEFHSLYQAVKPLPNIAKYKTVIEKLKMAFQRSDYMNL